MAPTGVSDRRVAGRVSGCAGTGLPAAALPVRLAEDPRHRRRAHPALQRPRHRAEPRDLQPGCPRRRPTGLRPDLRSTPGL